MLDIKLIRDSPETVERNLEKRGDKEKIKLLHQLIKYDKERREAIRLVEELRQKRNVITREIAEQRAKGVFVKKLMAEAKEIPGKIKALDNSLDKLGKKCDSILYKLPNILHDSVPIGKDENENQVVREWGKKTEFSFKPKDHIDIGLALDCLDIERAAKISGARFYFLKNELAIMDLALMRLAADFIRNRGFTFAMPPFMMRREPYTGVVDMDDFENVLYKIENEDLYMIATSEHPLTAQHTNEIIEEGKLPLLYAGLSTNFRKEAGAHGKDTKGIFRVHQFNKTEQIVICKPDESWEWHEKLIANAEDFFKLLDLPYRVVSICTGDIGSIAAKKYDLEAWMPVQNCYREMVSCSNCTDYQARRLAIRFKGADQAVKGIVHTLNSTLVTDRALVAIMENCQQEDGSIKVPKALQKLCGFDEMTSPS